MASRGGAETPRLWVRLLDSAVKKAKHRWQESKLGASLPTVGAPELGHGCDGVSLDLMIWADDLIIMGRSAAEVKTMFTILGEELVVLGLGWKPGSLEVLRAGGWAEGGGEVVSWAGSDVRKVDAFTLLGTRVNSYGLDSCSADFRISAAWSHFFERKSTLCDKRIPIRLRWKRLQQTVFRTALHGSGGWAITDLIEGKLRKMENSMVKIMLCCKCRVGETEGEFHHRCNSKIKFLRRLFGFSDICVLWRKLHVGWLGHIQRLPGHSTLKRIVNWKNHWWRTLETIAGRRLGFATAGKPKATAEDWITTMVGPAWPELAGSRSEWKALNFELNGRGQGLDTWSNRTTDLLGGFLKTAYTFQCMHLVDNLQVCNQSRGVWAVAKCSPFHSYVSSLRWSEHVLKNCLGVGGVGGGDLMKWVPRSQNEAADWIANYVLDVGEIENLVLPSIAPVGMWSDSRCLIILSSDGAWRQKSKRASAGCVVAVKYEDDMQIVAVKGSYVVGDNVIAEYDAACIARRLFIKWMKFAGLAT